MEARFFSAALIAASLLSLGADHRTQNFLVSAASPEVARALGDAGEIYRRELALEWLGHELPPWHEPCPIRVQVGPHLGAGGATSFMFDRGRPFGWQMTIQGSYDRLLDSVLPHEILHMLFATHFGRPLPRWADEGAATSVEHVSEKRKQDHLLVNFLTTGRGIAFNQLFAMKEYPQDILPLYSQGFSLVRFLIAQGGKRKFVEYVGDGMNWNNWTAATRQHYGFQSLSELQLTWLDWVRQGSPRLDPQGPLLASRNQASPPAPAFPLGSATATTPEQIPLHNAVASTADPGSWYARQRDLAQTSGTADASAASALHPPLEAAAEAVEPLIRSSLTRPQEPGTMQPTIIQWQSSPPPLVALPAPSYQDSAASFLR